MQRILLIQAANGVIFGLGTHSYVLGLEAMLHLLSGAWKSGATKRTTGRRAAP